MIYEIQIQFLNPQAKFSTEAKSDVKEAVAYYNTRSLIARNPKKILETDFSDDDVTLTLKLQSEAMLPVPGKALKLFSTFLVKKPYFSEHLLGRQLFKMYVAPQNTQAPERTDNSAPPSQHTKTISIDEFKTLPVEIKLDIIYQLLLYHGMTQ